jgi:hypothetical protein
MALPNIFEKEITEQVISRIKTLTPASKPLWGKMNVGQMLAHLNISYRYVYEPEQFKPVPGFLKFIFKLMIKPMVVNEKPYKKNGRTAPDFIIIAEKDFLKERNELIAFLEKTQTLGIAYFDGKASHSFGNLNATEWNNLFYKHLDHHLRQFGV